ncbi:hypothetical protein Dda_6943 [Drechslerella dactyloides]|uniref:Uncharacterized protein n=1 Tax=Drechslerella dactyloides TaxID=74499 RepID=A0AAD6IWJ4_DREDA|nr:hypothetical protein Dda_6943 [Drechslerella dactyloides]
MAPWCPTCGKGLEKAETDVTLAFCANTDERITYSGSDIARDVRAALVGAAKRDRNKATKKTGSPYTVTPAPPPPPAPLAQPADEVYECFIFVKKSGNNRTVCLSNIRHSTLLTPKRDGDESWSGYLYRIASQSVAWQDVQYRQYEWDYMRETSFVYFAGNATTAILTHHPLAKGSDVNYFKGQIRAILCQKNPRAQWGIVIPVEDYVAPEPEKPQSLERGKTPALNPEGTRRIKRVKSEHFDDNFDEIGVPIPAQTIQEEVTLEEPSLDNWLDFGDLDSIEICPKTEPRDSPIQEVTETATVPDLTQPETSTQTPPKATKTASPESAGSSADPDAIRLEFSIPTRKTHKEIASRLCSHTAPTDQTRL